MTFFQQQVLAKRTTRNLLILFGLTVCGIVLAVHSILVFLLTSQTSGEALTKALFSPPLFVATASVTLLIIGLGTLFKMYQLRGGGAQVATSLGGRLLPADSGEYHHRKLLNIVEEMAIASGIPVPPVYLIPEPSINAFAAGYTPDDAVIGVNEGTIKTLTRDELQGVIAHEFSHILNGDMRLNIRLIGLLHGLLVIALIGRFLLYSRSRRSYGSYNRNSKGNGGGAFMFGLGLLAVGWIGVLGGRLIKAAVSRQREFLADASAVQFTRNPLGIADALKKIGGFTLGSKIQHPNAEETSHLFFGEALGAHWFSLLATHPPLSERIKRLDPSFTGQFVQYDETFSLDEAEENSSQLAGGFTSGFAPSNKSSLVHSVHNPSPEHTVQAQAILSDIPLQLHQNLHSLAGAEAAILALLTSDDATIEALQQDTLLASQSKSLYDLYKKTLSIFRSNPSARKHGLPIIDIALGSLRILNDTQRKDFLALTRAFVLADGDISLFEYMLHKTFLKHFSIIPKKKRKTLSLKEFQEAAHKLLSVAITLSSDSDKIELFHKTIILIDHENKRQLINVQGKELEALDESLEQLSSTSPEQKELLLHTIEAVVTSDSHVSQTEIEFFRAVAASLDCPIPPILRNNQKSATDLD